MGNADSAPVIKEINCIPSVSKIPQVLVKLTCFLWLPSRQTTNRCFQNSSRTQTARDRNSTPSRVLPESFLELRPELKGAVDNRTGSINLYKSRDHFCPLSPHTLVRNQNHQVLKSLYCLMS